jgi:hypothetical protein
MRSSIEFHDSTISAITQEPTSIRISLDAYVHRWDLVDAEWRGTGWVQPVHIIITSSADSMICQVPVDIRDGEVRTVQSNYENLVPLPFAATGPVWLRLELVSGDVLAIAGRDITIDPAGEASYVENLPDEFRPSDAG